MNDIALLQWKRLIVEPDTASHTSNADARSVIKSRERPQNRFYVDSRYYTEAHLDNCMQEVNRGRQMFSSLHYNHAGISFIDL